MSRIAPGLAPPAWPAIDHLPGSARVHAPVRGGAYAAARPALDLLAAALLLVPALPIIGVCWLLVRLTSPGPGFYTQTRLGRDGRPYRILKLRTMTHNVEKTSGVRWSTGRGDARVTRVGKVLRDLHFDELPQLVNVLRGEMSLIGPRPERPEVIQALGLAEDIPGYAHRLRVRPGVTGLAQVQLPPDTTMASVRHKVAYDVYAITHGGWWLDLRVLAATGLKTAGVRPEWVRRLCRLPDRDAVAAAFVDALTPPMPPAPEAAKRSSGVFPAVV